jgi:DNA-binding MarR family transcriptional regulator
MEEHQAGDQADEVEQHPRGASAGEAQHRADRGQEARAPRCGAPRSTRKGRHATPIVSRYIAMAAQITNDDYERLLEFRTRLRRFSHWSEEQAVAAGLTPAQHQLLLAIRGHRDPKGPTIGDVAEALLLRHHSVVGLIDRAEAAGFVRRQIDRGDQRIVRLHLTALGRGRLRRLSARHFEELERLTAQGGAIWADFASDPARSGGPDVADAAV